jgi:uncharacterized cofD-like protein
MRNCLAALSNDEQLLTKLFQYRFASGAGLNGHNLGNLLITALTDLTGSFEEALAETGRVLAVQGQVMPSTLDNVRLVAQVQEKRSKKTKKVDGESKIPKQQGLVKRVWLEPENPHAFPPAVQALLAADLILVGPGSLYTSLLANLLVPDILASLKASRALKFYICNIATQPGETDGYTCSDHVQAIERYTNGRIFDLILCNNKQNPNMSNGIEFVELDDEVQANYAVYCTNLIDSNSLIHHDSEKLAKTILDLFYERTGPLSTKDIL